MSSHHQTNLNRVSHQELPPVLPPPVVETGHRRANRSSSRGSRRGHRERSRSSRSRGRGRNRSSFRHRGHNQCRGYCVPSEKNFAAATCSMIAIALLCISLELDWIHTVGGKCRHLNDPDGSLRTLGASRFFYGGQFFKSYPLTEPGDRIYKFGPGYNDVLVNCVTYWTVVVFKASISLIFLAIVCSLIAFILDLLGPKYRLLKSLRRNAFFNILSVIICVSVNLFIFWIVTTVEVLQLKFRQHPGSKVLVTFDDGFYLVTAAGALSVVACAFNCLRRHSLYETGLSNISNRPEESLYFDDTEALLPPLPSTNEDVAPLIDLPPPPAYTP